MKKVDDSLLIMINDRSEEIAEICFFQDKQYGEIDQKMLDREVLQLIKDIWLEHQKIYTVTQIKKVVFTFLKAKNTKFTLSCLN